MSYDISFYEAKIAELKSVPGQDRKILLKELGRLLLKKDMIEIADMRAKMMKAHCS